MKFFKLILNLRKYLFTNIIAVISNIRNIVEKICNRKAFP